MLLWLLVVFELELPLPLPGHKTHSSFIARPHPKAKSAMAFKSKSKGGGGGGGSWQLVGRFLPVLFFFEQATSCVNDYCRDCLFIPPRLNLFFSSSSDMYLQWALCDMCDVIKYHNITTQVGLGITGGITCGV
jgi:hypothetical protein